MQKIDLFKNYENARLASVADFRAEHPESTFSYEKIGKQPINGIPISITRNEKGRLDVTFIPDTHLLAIGATRSGKTTGYVIPTLNVLLKKKNKPSIVISDPKQELFRDNAAKFEKAGYDVLFLDFTNYKHSDCWNPLTKYFHLYQRYLAEEDVEEKASLLDEVEKGITTLSLAIIPTENTRDPFWEDSARDLLCAILYGLLEDSGENGDVTEYNFSFDSVLRIFDSFSDNGRDYNYDGGYFTSRDIETSKAYQLAKKCIIEQAGNTRKCISSSFAAKISKFRDTSVRRITSTNTFSMHELDGDKPTVIFLSYKDEESLHYEIISMFLSNLYAELIGIAREKGTKLDRPFYFLLDEFGNLPKFHDFDKVISACGGRNIWFLLILQSYAQLYHIYGKETAEIIKDNLNTHVFFGTNNPETKREFSDECGKQTVISPISALNGNGESIDRYEKDTVALVPVSALTRIAPGECYVTQMREDILLSKIERSYLCPEFAQEETSSMGRDAKVKFSDPKYSYKPTKKTKEQPKRSNPFDL